MTKSKRLRAALSLSAAAAVMAFVMGGTAQAAEKPLYGPPGAWVRAVPMAKPDPAQADAPVQVLLESNQVDFAPDGDTFFSEIAVRLQTPAGLQAVQPSATWNPETDTVTIHKVQILRGDQVIDVLAKGQAFTVMRRESNLERAMIDGMLTAVLQPEDLQVGDIVVYSMSIKRQDPVLKGHSEAFLGNGAKVPIGRLLLRGQWDAAKPVRWRESDDLTPGKPGKTADGAEFAIDMTNARRADVPSDAPARYNEVSEVEFSQFKDWNEISSLMAPLYGKASALKADSPLKAEAAKIRAASADPKVQAAAALQLVQNQVRYLFLGMNQGGYVPADADETWTRRFGDCKGKTALLLALLHELGIKAEPAMVSTGHGDGLDTHLPLVELFDHVIVRAEIGGKVYWLDGTRYGDHDLDAIAVPDFRWALPVRTEGAGLEAMKATPLDKPVNETLIRIDASAGLSVPALTHVETILSGDEATGFNMGFEALPADQRDKALRQYWSQIYDWIEVRKVSASFDKAAGQEHIVMDGDANMGWSLDEATRTWRYETDGTRVGWGYETKRDDGPHKDAPVSIQFPAYYHNHEEIILPKGGAGFTLDGDPVDKTLGGAVFKRSMAIKKGVLTIDASKRAVTSEIPFKDEVAAAPVLTAMYKKPVLLVAPLSYKVADNTDKKLPGDTTKSAADLVGEGTGFYEQRQYDQALGRYNQALRLDPSNAKALWGRGIVFLYGKNNDTAAIADLQQAVKSDPTLWQAYDALGTAYGRENKLPEAIDAFSKALAIYPNDVSALNYRASAYMMKGDKDKAKADVQAVLQLDPSNIAAIGSLSQMAMEDHKRDEAKDILRKAIEASPDDPALYLRLAEVTENCFDLKADECRAAKTEAVAVYDKVIALQPTAFAYAMRAQDRPVADRQAKLDDIDAAIKLDPKETIPYMVRAAMYLDAKEYDKALTDLNQAVSIDPKDAQALSIRAKTYFLSGKPDLAFADLDTIAAAYPKDSMTLNNICWERATRNHELDKALSQCNAALVLMPDNAAALDSRALVELRMGQLDASLNDYNAALKLRPNQAGSLYGRGVVEARKGMTKESQTDLAAARKTWATVDTVWATDYGIKP